MRWIWIDRIVSLQRGQRCVAVKNVSLAEDVLHDHFPAEPEARGRESRAPADRKPEPSAHTDASTAPAASGDPPVGEPSPDPDPDDLTRPLPVFPNSLIIEGMAQTAGILVGHANDFRERVLLAKIRRAEFRALALPGTTLRYEATIERLDESGAFTTGRVELLRPGEHAQLRVEPMGEVDLMFSHIDHARTELELPEHNFVFTSRFMEMVRGIEDGDEDRESGARS